MAKTTLFKELIVFYPAVMKDQVDDFVDKFINSGRDMGLTIPMPNK